MTETKCPKCKSTHIEEHGTEPGDFHWWLCRECGYNWPTAEERKVKQDDGQGESDKGA